MSKHLFFGALILGTIYIAGSWPESGPKRFHTKEEIAAFNTNLLPIDSTVIFPTSAACKGCHGLDPNGYAMIDLAGNDVNIYDDWRATMMANSAKDPFWRAKVSHEILLYPQHSTAIQSKCVTCHAPNGHYTAFLRGLDPYLIEDMLQDSIGIDGVTCSTCHKISDQNLGTTFSGEIYFDTTRVVFGPYPGPFGAPMEEFVGFKPLYRDHITDAGICAPCHTLVTHPFDYEGNSLGTSYVEQATYHEWLNSSYPELGVSCQGCHMPRIDDPVIISSNYLFLDPRTPYGLHELVGANTMMLKLMKEHRQTLGIDADAEHYDATIASTLSMLQERTLQISIEVEEETADSVTFALKLVNKAGHKFPSGYPSRRAFVAFTVVNEAGDTLFQSGRLRPDFEVEGHDSGVEPHYQLINRPDQAQIYEIVPADVNGQFTSILERAYSNIKDNRLPPEGFSVSHPVYDTTRIEGQALDDPDFNRKNGVEGSGADVVHYRIGIEGYQGNISAYAAVYYQSLPPRWMAELFDASTPEIETFRAMFNSADKSPVMVGSAAVEDYFVDGTVAVRDNATNIHVNITPNPTTNGICSIDVQGAQLRAVTVFSADGRRLAHHPNPTNPLRLPGKGVFLLQIDTNRGKVVRKVVAY